MCFLEKRPLTHSRTWVTCDAEGFGNFLLKPSCMYGFSCGKKNPISVVSSARLSSRALVSRVFMWVSFLWVLLGVLTEPMTRWRCLQWGGNQAFDVPESLEVRVWVCINLQALRTWPSPQSVRPLWQWRMQRRMQGRGLLHRSQR